MIGGADGKNKNKNKTRYRVGDLFFVLAGPAAFQRQIPGQPELVLLHGLADVLQQSGLDARPVGTAVRQQFAAELEYGVRRLRNDNNNENTWISQ